MSKIYKQLTHDAVAGRFSPLAGKVAPRSLLVDVAKLVTAYYTGIPDPA